MKEVIEKNNKKIRNILYENNNDILKVKIDNKIKEKQNMDEHNTKLLLQIKSKLIFNKLFSNLNLKTKLKVIKYNNILKNKLNFNIDNYKNYSGRFIEYESNGRGKEYDFSHNLLYEGEFLNGKRWNGKGKEFNDNGR